MDAIAIIIPARYNSSRFPGKVLQDLDGKMVIQHVYERCARVAYTEVSTDDVRIFDAVTQFGGNVRMSPSTCRSGTDRVAFAAKELDKDAFKIFVNVQADEPLINPATILQTCALVASGSFSMATAATYFSDSDPLEDKDVVKVLIDNYGKALWFSRFPIPYSRKKSKETCCYNHIGIYAFSRSALERFAECETSPFETGESLEQLRALHNGIDIGVHLSGSDVGMRGVNTRDDLEYLRKITSCRRARTTPITDLP